MEGDIQREVQAERSAWVKVESRDWLVGKETKLQEPQRLEKPVQDETDWP